MPLSSEYLNSLASMTADYHRALMEGAPDSPSGRAREYLLGRGITVEAAGCYRLGLVNGSHDEHEKYQGMIAIPYLTKLAGPVSFKFRVAHKCDAACQHAKYLTPYPTRIFNPLAMDKADQLGWIAITEGEINAITLDHFCGIPAVGIPGAEMWKAHPEWKELFRGYASILLFPDADEAGERLAENITRDIDTARIVRLPGEMDANEAYLALGAAAIRRIANV